MNGMSDKLVTLSSWAKEGIHLPKPTVDGFGGDKPDTYHVCSVCELSPEAGYRVANSITAKIGTWISVADLVEGIERSSVTGMELVGFSASRASAENGVVDFTLSDTVMLGYPGRLVLFPCYDTYVVYPQIEQTVTFSKEYDLGSVISTNGVYQLPNYIDESLVPALDLDKCNITAVVDVTCSVEFRGTTGKEDVLQVNGRRVSSNNGMKQEFVTTNMSTVGTDKTSDVSISLVRLTAQKPGPLVTYTSVIREWRILPKMVYNPAHPDEHPSGG